jgi:LuxR family transcriptional regulator, maltose regulon positive regulatory protein
MADPRAAEQPEREVLLATKLHVPARQAGLVLRPRLSGRLREGLAQGLVLVSAPAGYGKTVLLADWARNGQRAAAWLSLDAADNDPARFWRHVVAALDQGGLGIGARTGPLLGPPAPSSLEPFLAALVNELTDRPGGEEAVLVLDDYHVITSPLVHESVGFLLDHQPAGLCVVLASRSQPPLRLARRRARAQLTELRAADLRFTAIETAALLGFEVAGADLPAEVTAALTARTEGWAAGLQLAALSLRGQADVTGFVAAFTGSNRYVLDFLTEEVLERQDDEVRAFLLDTSVLDRLSGPLCDAVTGRPGSQALLERVERAGLFLVPLDEVRGWWRYHHLFADLLRARLGRDEPGRAGALHRRASAWYQQHGLADDAIAHAVAAGDAVRAAQLIEQYFDEFYYLRGEAETIQRWFSALPADLMRSRPRLLLAQAQLAAAAGHVDEVERAADGAEQASGDSDGQPFEPTVGQADSMLMNIPGQVALERCYLAQLRGDAGATAEFAAQVLACSGADEWVLSSTARGFLAVAEWLRGRLAAAEQAFNASIDGWRAAGQATLAAWGSYQLAQVQRARGQLDAAVLTSDQALAAAAGSGGTPLPASGPAYVSLAGVAYQRDELDLARRHATEGVALCRQFVYTPPLAAGLVTLAWLRQASGDRAGALAAIDQAGEASPVPAGLLNPVPAQRARLLLARGDLNGAARWAAGQGLSADDEPAYPREAGHLVLARVLLAQDRPGQALPLLGRLEAAAAAQDRRGSLIEIGAIRALALAASGEPTAAVTALAGTLTMAAPQGHLRVFVDEGRPMATLLGRLVAAQRASSAAAGVPFAYLVRLQQAFDAEAQAADRDRDRDRGRGRSPDGPGLVDPLTSRELEVLRMLAVGQPNQAIARDLVVTLDTVKKHVSHVLGKLGAANRTEAVARARELGLI